MVAINPPSDTREGPSTMYAELLARALHEWADAPRDADLVEHALACRAAMLRESWRSTNAYSALAAEVSYDRSLIKLAEANELSAGTATFAHPTRARHLLERALAERGVDLAALALEPPTQKVPRIHP